MAQKVKHVYKWIEKNKNKNQRNVKSANLSNTLGSGHAFRINLWFSKIFIYFWLCWVFVAAHELPLVAVSGSYSLVVVCGLLIAVASLVAKHGLSSLVVAACGLAVQRHVGSFQTRDQIHIPCIGRQSLHHWTTREVPNL